MQNEEHDSQPIGSLTNRIVGSLEISDSTLTTLPRASETGGSPSPARRASNSTGKPRGVTGSEGTTAMDNIKTPAEIMATADFQRPSASEPPTKNSSPSKKLMASLWMRMVGLYGHKWTSSYGESDADGTWQSGLSGLTANDFERGLRNCMNCDDGWPPSLPDFRRMCMEYRAPEHRPFPPANRLIESDAMRQAKKEKVREMKALWRSKGLMP